MEAAEFATRILKSPDLESKLAPPQTELVDSAPRLPVPVEPTRGERLRIVSAREAPVPKIRGWPEIDLRRRILHALANHELQAVELYAQALVRFSGAPDGLRRDLLHIILEEQRHARSYVERLRLLGTEFGAFPVSGYFWRKAPLLETPMRFVCVMALTFENANLDHSLESRDAALEAKDCDSADLFQSVHEDEIGHVRFGWTWLQELGSPDQDAWSNYREHLGPPLHPGRASGRIFHEQPRRQAGLDEDFIRRLKDAHARRREAPHLVG